MNILVLNAGSSSLKFALYEESEKNLSQLLSGNVSRIGSEGSVCELTSPSDPRASYPMKASTHIGAVEYIVSKIQNEIYVGKKIERIGCRVVHGGGHFHETTLVTPSVLREIRALGPLAPLHNKIDSDVIETCQRIIPDAVVGAVFDNTFHRTLPPVAYRYGIPEVEEGDLPIRRYGFHGIAHSSVLRSLVMHMPKEQRSQKIITCHLGNGASICAIQEGKSIDTSMGFTPMEGLIMGTRSGDIDPGILLYLQNSKSMSSQELSHLLNEESGLLGISGTSSDVRDLEASAQKGDLRAELALKCFAYRVVKYIGAYAAVLGGIDAIAFSGGIGEHSASMRGRICSQLTYLGFDLDEAKNESGLSGVATRITTDQSTVDGWIILADEEREIANEILTLR